MREVVAHLYVDGGVVQRNPSPIGGTWACVLVSGADEEIHRASGFISNEQVGRWLTNNYTELLAAVEGLSLMVDGWTGIIYTDSLVTLRRLVASKPSMNGIPDELRQRLRVQKARLGKFRAVLVKGHPTLADLKRGKTEDGVPVSKWNVLCDELCKVAAFIPSSAALQSPARRTSEPAGGTAG